MINANTRDFKKLARMLQTFAGDVFPVAVMDSLNRAAFETRRESLDNIRRKMITRNAWTRQSVQVDMATVTNQRAIVGSVAPYMETQEFGGVKTRKGKEGVAIATAYSAGQGEGQQPRTRLPRSPNRLRAITLTNKSVTAKSRQQRNAIVVKVAAQTGQKFVYLDLGRRKGIFKVVGGKRKPTVRMLHDLTRQSVVIPRNRWLEPAFDSVVKRFDQIAVRSLRFHANKAGLFR